MSPDALLLNSSDFPNLVDRNPNEESKVTDFRLMKINFQEKESRVIPLNFTTIGTPFHLVGLVLNIYILDTSSRLLCALIVIPNSDNLGIYVMLDWNKKECVSIDTGMLFVNTISSVLMSKS